MCARITKKRPMRRSLKRKRNKFTARWAVWRACCAFDEGTLLEAEACLKRGVGMVPFSAFGISSSLLPRPTLFSRKKLPGHPEGADLRENRLAFRGKAACRHPCEPLPANDALGNGVQMEIVPLSRRAGACPSRDAETLERAREPSLALFSLYKWRVHDVYPENVNKLQPLFWMGYCYKSS